MEKYNLLLNEIRQEDKEAAAQFIDNTKLYIVQMIRLIEDNEDKTIKIAENIYKKVIFSNNQVKENENFTDYLNNLIEEELKPYLLKVNFDSNVNNQELKVNKNSISYDKELYNKPEVEQSFVETMKSLSFNEKIIYFEYLLKNGNIKEISNFFNIDDIVTVTYINNAYDQIEEKAESFFKKYKVHVNYSRFNAITSTINLCKDILNFNVEGLAVNVIKKKTMKATDDLNNKDKEDKEMNFKDFVSNYLKGKLDEWLRNRIKQALLTAGIKLSTSVVAEEAIKDTTIATSKAAVTSAKVASGAKAAAVASTAAKGSIASKIIIGTLATAVIGTGGYVAVNEIVQENHVKKIVEEVEPIASYTSSEDSAIQAEISLYSENNDETMDVIVVNAELHTEEIDQKLLAAAKAASTIMNGVSMDYEVNGDTISVSASADRNKIDYNLIEKVEEKTGIQLGPELDQMVEMFKNGDTEQVLNILNQMGLSAGVKE